VARRVGRGGSLADHRMTIPQPARPCQQGPRFPLRQPGADHDAHIRRPGIVADARGTVARENTHASDWTTE